MTDINKKDLKNIDFLFSASENTTSETISSSLKKEKKFHDLSVTLNNATAKFHIGFDGTKKSDIHHGFEIDKDSADQACVYIKIRKDSTINIKIDSSEKEYKVDKTDWVIKIKQQIDISHINLSSNMVKSRFQNLPTWMSSEISYISGRYDTFLSPLQVAYCILTGAISKIEIVSSDLQTDVEKTLFCTGLQKVIFSDDGALFGSVPRPDPSERIPTAGALLSQPDPSGKRCGVLYWAVNVDGHPLPNEPRKEMEDLPIFSKPDQTGVALARSRLFVNEWRNSLFSDNLLVKAIAYGLSGGYVTHSTDNVEFDMRLNIESKTSPTFLPIHPVDPNDGTYAKAECNTDQIPINLSPKIFDRDKKTKSNAASLKSNSSLSSSFSVSEAQTFEQAIDDISTFQNQTHEGNSAFKTSKLTCNSIYSKFKFNYDVVRKKKQVMTDIETTDILASDNDYYMIWEAKGIMDFYELGTVRSKFKIYADYAVCRADGTKLDANLAKRYQILIDFYKNSLIREVATILGVSDQNLKDFAPKQKFEFPGAKFFSFKDFVLNDCYAPIPTITPQSY